MNEEKIIGLNKSEEINAEANSSTDEKDKNTYTLKKPFEYEGKTHTELKFNFEKLNGNDMIQTESELRDRGFFFIFPESDTSFLITLASKAANINAAVLLALPVADVIAIKRMTQRFLNSRD